MVSFWNMARAADAPVTVEGRHVAYAQERHGYLWVSDKITRWPNASVSSGEHSH